MGFAGLWNKECDSESLRQCWSWHCWGLRAGPAGDMIPRWGRFCRLHLCPVLPKDPFLQRRSQSAPLGCHPGPGDRERERKLCGPGFESKGGNVLRTAGRVRLVTFVCPPDASALPVLLGDCTAPVSGFALGLVRSMKRQDISEEGE